MQKLEQVDTDLDQPIRMIDKDVDEFSRMGAIGCCAFDERHVLENRRQLLQSGIRYTIEPNRRHMTKRRGVVARRW